MKYGDKSFNFYIILILLIVLFESIAQYHIKKSKTTHGLLFLAIGMLSYSIVCLLLKKCYDFNGMGITNFVWSVVSIISMLTIGNIVFGEKLTKYDFIGILLSVSGLYLIFVYDHDN
jgi:drug/metabolite transporter (DMT)-like permease